MKKQTLILLSLGLYVLSTGVSYAAFQTAFGTGSTLSGDGSDNTPGRFSQLISPLVPKAGEGKVADTSAPKTEACPLNGQMYTKAEKDAWDTRTPLAVMIENHTDARPQSGLGSADIVYEAVAEGGITRFMAVVYCDAQAKDVLMAPVRSARTYFIDWASTYQEPLYTHVGGANLPGPSDALGQLEQYRWAGKNNLNQFSIGFPTFARNYSRITLADGKSLATEHTMETSSERLWKFAKDNRKITSWAGASKFQPWEFKDEAQEKGTTSSVSYDFWENYKDFSVNWAYDSQSNSYRRNMAGEPHVDLNDGQQIAVKNVVILLTSEKGPINENKHMLYGTTGTGKAIVFQDGQAVQANWKKATRTDGMTFTGSNGKPLALNRGKTWISVLSTTNKTVEY